MPQMPDAVTSWRSSSAIRRCIFIVEKAACGLRSMTENPTQSSKPIGFFYDRTVRQIHAVIFMVKMLIVNCNTDADADAVDTFTLSLRLKQVSMYMGSNNNKQAAINSNMLWLPLLRLLHSRLNHFLASFVEKFLSYFYLSVHYNGRSNFAS